MLARAVCTCCQSLAKSWSIPWALGLHQSGSYAKRLIPAVRVYAQTMGLSCCNQGLACKFHGNMNVPGVCTVSSCTFETLA